MCLCHGNHSLARPRSLAAFFRDADGANDARGVARGAGHAYLAAVVSLLPPSFLRFVRRVTASARSRLCDDYVLLRPVITIVITIVITAILSFTIRSSLAAACCAREPTEPLEAEVHAAVSRGGDLLLSSRTIREFIFDGDYKTRR